MNRRIPRIALPWLLSVCISCASAPVRYYTLTRPTDKTLPVPQTSMQIEVRVVHMPPQLSRTALMVRTGSTEMTLLDNERWASPVNDEIQYALRLEVQRRLGRATGIPSAWTRLTLDVDIRHFEAELGRYAVLEASWSATPSATGQRTNGARATTCTFQGEESLRSGYAAMIEGYQREIAALADAIAAALTGSARGIEAPCPQSSKDPLPPMRG